jgi:hypothetical protein
MMQITIDAFSGRANPSWVIEGNEAIDLAKELARNRTAIADIKSGYQGLGYRGIIVEAMDDEMFGQYELPFEFVIANGGSLNDDKGFEIAERLIKTMRKRTSISYFDSPMVFDKDLQETLLKQLNELYTRDSTEADIAQGLVKAKVTCYIELGKFNPVFWNRSGVIGRNNCYNYASNWKTDTFAQPGKGCGRMYKKLSCEAVKKAALCDGCHNRYDCFPGSEKNRWLMALVVAPGYDYHWYRKQKEGFWGHKPGGTAAKNTDNNGNIIYNPQTCARYPYTDFCGYFYSCKSQQRRIR